MEYQIDIDHEILKSERLRLLILALLVGISALIELSSILLPGKEMETAMPRSIHLPHLFSMLALSTIFGILSFYTGSLIKKRRQPPFALKVLNSALEVLIPALLAIAFLFSTTARPYSEMLISKVFPLYSFIIILSVLRLRFELSIATGLLGATSYLAVSIPALNMDHIVLTFYILIQALFAGLVAIQMRKWLLRSISINSERNRIKNMFGQHVSPDVMNRLMEKSKDSISEIKHVCVMFLDIRDFTSFAEKKDPNDVVEYLNLLFKFMIAGINKYGGIVNKFTGDGLMAIFGAPLSTGHNERNALHASLEILRALAEKLRQGEIQPTRIGIGLHCGNVHTGLIGSSDRKEYTVIGDTVNTAARIEALTKELDTDLLFSETVFKQIGTDFPEMTYVNEITVKGKRDSIKVYTCSIDKIYTEL